MSLIFYAQQVILLLAEISMQVYSLLIGLLEYLLLNCLGFFVGLNLGRFRSFPVAGRSGAANRSVPIQI